MHCIICNFGQLAKKYTILKSATRHLKGVHFKTSAIKLQIVLPSQQITILTPIKKTYLFL